MSALANHYYNAERQMQTPEYQTGEGREGGIWHTNKRPSRAYSDLGRVENVLT